MSIRRITIKIPRTGQPDYSDRLVESIRTGQILRQRPLMNLARHFDLPPNR